MEIEPLSKTKLAALAQLKLKKHRDRQALFVAEGMKCAIDTAACFDCETIVGIPDALISVHEDVLAKFHHVYSTDAANLKKLSQLATAPEVIAYFHRPESEVPEKLNPDELYLALDGIQDPGNLGTIIRTADWFGVKTIFASRDTADVFNPKTIQATMGSLSRVTICYTDLCELFDRNPDVPVYGTLLNGKDIYRQPLGNGILCMGNEGRGLREETKRRVSCPLFIPPFPPIAPHPESLNVAIATAVALSQFRYGKEN